MFVQIKKSGGAEYIYIIESFRKNGAVAHRTVKKLGRLDLFLEKDPEALEKLREEVRRNSQELRTFSTARTVSQIRSLAIKKEQQELQDGMPSLNYSSFVIKAVWCGCLKLDYRLNYLQRRYHQKLNLNLNQTFFERALARILKFENTGLKFGIETAIMSSSFNPEDPLADADGFLRLLSIERFRILNFVRDHLQSDHGIDPEKIKPQNIDDKTYEKLLHDNNENPVYGRFTFEMVANAVVRVLEKKVADAGITADFHEIKNSLRRALLLVDCPIGGDGPILYIKANNGHYVRTMNNIMTALGLLPLLNIQDKTELSRRLRTKFTSDEQIIPPMMYAHLIAAGENSDN